MSYTIEITTRVVSYRAEECRFKDEDGHNADGSGPECTGECTWLDGDSRELESPDVQVIEPDRYDLDLYDGSPVAWACHYLGLRTSVAEASLYPIPDAVPEREWLSGTYEDPYQGDQRVTEETVRLVGSWTDQERAEVFRAL